MTAEQALAGVSRLLLDTNPAIYILERDATFQEITWSVLNEALRLGVQLVISPLTLMEVMAKPGATTRELQRFAEFCLATEEIEFRPILFDDAFSIRVGNLRRTTSLKLPDCVQIACAEVLQCDAILTNDDWKGKSPTRVIMIADISYAQPST